MTSLLLPSPNLSQRERDWVTEGEGLGCFDSFGDATMGRLFALPLGQAEDWGNLWVRENEDFI